MDGIVHRKVYFKSFELTWSSELQTPRRKGVEPLGTIPPGVGVVDAAGRSIQQSARHQRLVQAKNRDVVLAQQIDRLFRTIFY